MPKEKSTGVVLFRFENGERMFLLLHYGHGHWDFPKGHVEAGETEHQTALRELLEETGIAKAAIIDGFRETVSYFFRDKGRTIFKDVVYFVAETPISEIKLSHEHIGFAWLPYDSALKKITYENSKGILRKANAFLIKLV